MIDVLVLCYQSDVKIYNKDGYWKCNTIFKVDVSCSHSLMFHQLCQDPLGPAPHTNRSMSEPLVTVSLTTGHLLIIVIPDLQGRR